jgi:hypothetical protein
VTGTSVTERLSLPESAAASCGDSGKAKLRVIVVRKPIVLGAVDGTCGFSRVPILNHDCDPAIILTTNGDAYGCLTAMNDATSPAAPLSCAFARTTVPTSAAAWLTPFGQ